MVNQGYFIFIIDCLDRERHPSSLEHIIDNCAIENFTPHDTYNLTL